MLFKKCYVTKLFKYIQIRKVSNFNLVGRKLIEPKDITPEEIKSIIWTALEIKDLHKSNTLNINKIKGKSIVYINTRIGDEISTIPMAAACQLMKTCFINITAENLDASSNLLDSIKFVESNVDLIIMRSKYLTKLVKIRDKVKLPIISSSNASFSIVLALQNLMTIFEYFGYFKDLKITWIGPSCRLINTYLCFSSVLEIDLSFCCANSRSHGVSPTKLDLAKKYEVKTNPIKEYYKRDESLKDANVIVVRDDYSENHLKLVLDDLKNVHKDFCILQNYPRNTYAADDGITNHKNNLCWAAADNTKYIFAALILRFLYDYQHITEPPKLSK